MNIDELYDEIYEHLDDAILKTLDVQEYEIDDKRVRRPRLRDLADYEDRMLAKKARKENNYKSHFLTRFNFPK